MTRYEIEPDRSQVWIEGSSSIHPVHATAAGLTGWIEFDGNAVGAGLVEIEVERLSSGNPLVDRETRRRVDAKRHPTIRGTVTSVGTDGSTTGDIEFRGETCSVSGTLEIALSTDGLVIEGTQTFDVRDWGLKPPRLGLLRVHPDVVVRIRVEATTGS